METGNGSEEKGRVMKGKRRGKGKLRTFGRYLLLHEAPIPFSTLSLIGYSCSFILYVPIFNSCTFVYNISWKVGWLNGIVAQFSVNTEVLLPTRVNLSKNPNNTGDLSVLLSLRDLLNYNIQIVWKAQCLNMEEKKNLQKDAEEFYL